MKPFYLYLSKIAFVEPNEAAPQPHSPLSRRKGTKQPNKCSIIDMLLLVEVRKFKTGLGFTVDGKEAGHRNAVPVKRERDVVSPKPVSGCATYFRPNP